MFPLGLEELMKILGAIMMGQIKRDKIAEDMWKDYQRVLSERGP